MKKYRDKWWYSTPIILVLSIFSIFIIPGIIAIILIVYQMTKRKSFYETLHQDELYNKSIREKEQELQKHKEDNQQLTVQIEENKKIIDDQEMFIADLRMEFDNEVKKERAELLHKAKLEAENIMEKYNQNLTEDLTKTTDYQAEIKDFSVKHSRLIKEYNFYTNKTRKTKN